MLADFDWSRRPPFCLMDFFFMRTNTFRQSVSGCMSVHCSASTWHCVKFSLNKQTARLAACLAGSEFTDPWGLLVVVNTAGYHSNRPNEQMWPLTLCLLAGLLEVVSYSSVIWNILKRVHITHLTYRHFIWVHCDSELGRLTSHDTLSLAVTNHTAPLSSDEIRSVKMRSG